MLITKEKTRNCVAGLLAFKSVAIQKWNDSLISAFEDLLLQVLL